MWILAFQENRRAEMPETRLYFFLEIIKKSAAVPKINDQNQIYYAFLKNIFHSPTLADRLSKLDCKRILV